MFSVVLSATLAANAVPIAVLDVREVGALEGKGALVAEEIARSLPPEAYKVTTASQLSAILGVERQRQMLGCDEGATSCSAELANALGAEVVTQTTLSKLDKGLRCDVVFIAGRDGRALDRVTAEGSGVSALLEKLHEGVEAAASRVYAQLRAGGSIEPGRAGVRRYAWAPAVAGVALAGTGAALFAVTAGTYGKLMTRDGRVQDPHALADSGRTTEAAAWAVTITGVVALAAAAGMFTLGAPTPAKVVIAPVASASGGGIGIAGEFP